VFGCPAAELPVRSTLGEAQCLELDPFSGAEPFPVALRAETIPW
jgi:hypothetical protein